MVSQLKQNTASGEILSNFLENIFKFRDINKQITVDHHFHLQINYTPCYFALFHVRNKKAIDSDL